MSPPRGAARNAPCFCGSGRKAKKCHPAGKVAADMGTVTTAMERAKRLLAQG